ncbi:GNAT family N-acetyltransferase [Pelagibius sp. Alg239-R121]|uniref:GNAT family N-acetyltransferase n=1 Tax=Pelagibius sp. Alg239-R121 TaxID=2993448 RepID=UPI0024A73005|nr:GNAT family N-acetyltransferase [Pelagibius sp. Alg239-R121]
MAETGEISIHAATAERWPDFVALMGERGGYGGCWCMNWRLTSKAYETHKGEDNRQAMKDLFEADRPPGLLAYEGSEAVAWCSVAPRSEFTRLKASRVLKPVDAQEVWSVSCFLIRKSHRKKGLSVALLKAACEFVKAQGGRIVEGYPIAPNKSPYPSVYAWTGFDSAFKEAGFKEVLRRSETRPIMRRSLKAL